MNESRYQQGQLNFVPSWSVTSAAAAQSAANRGYFRNVSQLIDAMLADDRVAAVVETRINGILGLSPSFEGEDQAAAEALQEGLYWRIFPEEVLKELLTYGLLLGVCPLEVIWDTDGGTWTPSLIPWHPQFLTFNERTMGYELQTMRGTIQAEPDDFYLFTPGGSARPWLKGLSRRLVLPYLIRQYASRDWARWSEKHGMPITGATMPETVDDDFRDKFFNDLLNLGSESVLEMPVGSDGQAVTVSLIEAASQSWQGFEKLWSKADVSIAISVLGQNLSTEVQGGSFAATAAHNQVRQDYLLADLEMLATFEHQILGQWYAYNYQDDPTRVPWVRRSIKRSPTDIQIEPHHLQSGSVRRNELRANIGLEPLAEDEGGLDFITISEDSQGRQGSASNTPLTIEPLRGPKVMTGLGTTHFVVRGLISDKLSDLQRLIDPGDLYASEDGMGLENFHHITIKYGLEERDLAKLQAVANTFPYIQVSYGDMGIFEADDYDVLYIQVFSDRLHQLNAAVARAIPCETTRPYVPHMTVAYLVKGAADKYMGLGTFAANMATFAAFEYSDRDGYTHPIYLSSEAYGAEIAVANRIALASGDKPGQGFLDGQDFVDQVPGRVWTTDPLDTKGLLEVILASEDQVDLTNKLKAFYADADPKQLQAALEKAIILAQLAGRYAVLEDL